MKLKLNSNVENVTNKAITYTENFKKNFYEELLAGKGPAQIFRESGFDTKIISQIKISSFALRIKKTSFETRKV